MAHERSRVHKAGAGDCKATGRPAIGAAATQVPGRGRRRPPFQLLGGLKIAIRIADGPAVFRRWDDHREMGAKGSSRKSSDERSANPIGDADKTDSRAVEKPPATPQAKVAFPSEQATQKPEQQGERVRSWWRNWWQQFRAEFHGAHPDTSRPPWRWLRRSWPGCGPWASGR